MLSQRILTLFVLIAVGPPAVLGIVLYFMTKTELTQTTSAMRSDLESVLVEQRSSLNTEHASRISELIDAQFQAVLQEVKLLTSMPVFANMDPASCQAVIDGLIEPTTGYSGLALATPDGRLAASVGFDGAPDVLNRDEFTTALARHVYISPVKAGDDPHGAYLLVYHVIGADGEPVKGCLIAKLPVAEIARRLGLDGTQQVRRTYVATAEGVMLFHSLSPADLPRQDPYASQLQRSPRQLSGSFREHGSLVSYARCSAVDWRVVVVMPVTQVLLPIHRTTGELEYVFYQLLLAVRQNSLIIIFVFLLIAAWAARLVAKDIVTPIDEVVHGIRLITQGGPTSRVPVHRQDEIGFLANAFNRMAEELRSSREELVSTQHHAEHIMRSVTDALLVVDARLKVISFNPTALETLGYSGSELTNKPITQVLENSPASEELVHRLELDEEVYTQNAFLRTSYGERLPVVLSCSALRDHRGRRAGAVIIARDITDQLQVEDDRARLAAIVQGSTDLIATLGLDGHMLFLNSAGRQLLGIREVTQLIGRELSDFCVSDAHGELREVLRATIESGSSECELNLQPLNDGASFPAHFRFSLLRDPRTQDPALIAGIGRDITERRRDLEQLKRYAAELEMSNRDLEQFAFVASHDLREPLRKLHNLSELLVRRYEGALDDKGTQILGFITASTNRMLSLIKDLLEYSRVGGQGKPLADTPMDAVVDAACANLSLAIRESKARIERQHLPHLHVDADQMALVYQNLISNAIKFCGDAPPRIEIGASRQDDAWQLWVRDHGIGFDQAFAERIFVIFQRLQSAQSREGTGIGLAICKKIIDTHGGRIWVESSEGHGATFYFTIPEPPDSLTPPLEEPAP